MLRFSIQLTVIAIFLHITGCQVNLSPKEYIGWVDNSKNGLISSVTVNDFEYTLQYKPAEYLAIREFDPENLTESKFEDYLKSLEGMQYYTLRIASKDKSTDVLKLNIDNSSEYYYRIQYLASELQSDIVLLDGEKEYPCILYHYERDYNISPFQTVLLGFQSEADNKLKKTADKKMIIHDRALVKADVEVYISGEKIDSAPQLTID